MHIGSRKGLKPPLLLAADFILRNVTDFLHTNNLNNPSSGEAFFLNSLPLSLQVTRNKIHYSYKIYFKSKYEKTMKKRVTYQYSTLYFINLKQK